MTDINRIIPKSHGLDSDFQDSFKPLFTKHCQAVFGKRPEDRKDTIYGINTIRERLTTNNIPFNIISEVAKDATGAKNKKTYWLLISK